MAAIDELSAEALAARLDLAAHPEGGFYRETYRADATWTSSDGGGGAPPRTRAVSTAILFLVTEASFSALHRIASDELWHFHAGAPLEIVSIRPDGEAQIDRLGLALDAGELPQRCVPAGWLFGSRLARPRPADRPPWSLVGCTVAPGFDFADFELPRRGALLERYPAHRALIEAMTR